MSDKCIETILNHRSVRKYKKTSIDEKDLQTILEAARRAPTGWGLGWINVIVVRDESLRKKIAELVGGQRHVEEAPILLVFTIDYARLHEILRKINVAPGKHNIGFLLAGLIDAGIASAFTAIVAESLGYGICYIAVYSAACEIANLLNIPKGSLPVVGLTIGVPDEKPGLRPRPPLSVIADYDKYGVLEDKVNETLASLREYMEKTWKLVLAENGVYENMGNMILECLRKQGFDI